MADERKYKHLVSGEAYGIHHKPGDIVNLKIPQNKIEEWLKAGIIEPLKKVTNGTT